MVLNKEKKEVEKTTKNVENINQSTGSKILAFSKELVILLVTAFVLAFIFKTFVFQPFKVEQTSMTYTVMPNERVLVNKFLYRFSGPKRGDIITVYSPEDTAKKNYSITYLFNGPRKILIKRVIATEGETIEIKAGTVLINGRAIKEKYISFINRDFQSFGATKVPKGYVFVMGDDRRNSKDSRMFGPVKKSDILGKAFSVYWPLDSLKML